MRRVPRRPHGARGELPIRSDVADLVISNGVIMVTPDARKSFGELVRVTKPGGTLVVSVYARDSWYHPVYRYGSPIVRKLRDWIGDTGLKLTLFPFFYVGTAVLLAVVMRRPMWIPIEISWNLFHDQFTTPHCTFHTVEEVAGWAEASGVICEERKREAPNQLITFRLHKPLPGRASVSLRGTLGDADERHAEGRAPAQQRGLGAEHAGQSRVERAALHDVEVGPQLFSIHGVAR